MELHVVILAAGQGTRMKSDLPKVLHPLAGRPLLGHVVEAARALDPAAVHVVHGHGGERVRAALADAGVDWIEQAEQLGTGHAVAQALPSIPDTGRVLVLYGDVPLIRPATLRRLVAAAGDGLALLTAELADPAGYGRVLRDPQGAVVGIVEHKDASPEQHAIREINTGFLAAGAALLRDWIGRLDNRNAQGEYYLTDIIGMAAADHVPVRAVHPDALHEILGVNDRRQLAELERIHQGLQAEALLLAGVSLADPARFDLRGTLEHGRDVGIDVNCVLEGRVVLGDRVRIGPGCLLRNVEIADDVEILANCVIEDAVIGAGSRKVNHLSYIGDTRIGRDVNVGAGTITCNYDGAHKHRTVIEDEAFIGSDTQLVAPVTVGRGATLGAGTTLTRDAPPGELTLSRSPQKTIKGWQRPRKERK